MPGMRDIKRKISSVKNTQKITKDYEEWCLLPRCGRHRTP